MNDKPWNENWGLHEGDMIDELVELDVSHGYHDTGPRWEEVRQRHGDEAIRRMWWFMLGAYQFDHAYMEDDGQPDEAQEWHDFDPDC